MGFRTGESQVPIASGTEKGRVLGTKKKIVLSDEYRYETKWLRVEIEALNAEVTKLANDLVNIGQL